MRERDATRRTAQRKTSARLPTGEIASDGKAHQRRASGDRRRDDVLQQARQGFPTFDGFYGQISICIPSSST